VGVGKNQGEKQQTEKREIIHSVVWGQGGRKGLLRGEATKLRHRPSSEMFLLSHKELIGRLPLETKGGEKMMEGLNASLSLL